MSAYPVSRQFLARLAERMFWTAVQAAAGVAIVAVADLPTAWAPVIAVALSAVKGFAARHIGDPSNPATLPAGV